MSYDTKSIREFLLQRFNDAELTQLCFDYFLDVYHDLSVSWSKGDKIQHLLEHCLAHGRFPDLMAALGRERPSAYEVHFSEHLVLKQTVASATAEGQRDSRQVFVSYAHEDAKFAHRLAENLKAHGVPVWIAPDSIKPGEKWVEAINRGLEACGVFVLVLTETAVASPWVKDETNVAIELSKEGKLRFIPLEVEPSDLPPLWRVFQRIPFDTDFEVGLKKLLVELGIDIEGKTAVPPLLPLLAKEHKTATGWQERLRTFPIWVWGLTAILLLLGLYAITQLSGDETNPGSNNQSSATVDELNIWSGFVDEADFQGEILVDKPAVGSLPVGGTHTWLLRSGPDRVDIFVEGNPNDNNFIRLYDDSSLNWESFIQPRGNVEGQLLEPGTQYIAFFDVAPDSDTIIAITDLNGNGSDYQLTLTESVPGEIGLGETVEGILVGDNPGIWLYRGDSAIVDIIFRLARQESGLVIITDENGRELAYVDTANDANEVLLSNFQLEAGYTIIVRDASNFGDSYTLTVE